ncbi:SubName: Full=Uncharacterized protein {ECO:0000313/EMBL:CCA67503.1} [Serendipita indica DSM 11827]|nr:SubName: Full=Uncharacterized protein {ECO:0000313/EMBL:CCA67503.1} [Serendipita indica DSM 11827]
MAKIPQGDTRRVINGDIPYKMVTVVQSDGKLSSQPIKLADLLREIDQSSHFVELVSSRDKPIVKIQSKKETLDKQKALKEKRAATKVVIKEVHISWVISPGDLDHKLAQARQYFDKGYRVWLVFSPKRGQLPPPQAECDAFVAKVHQMIEENAVLQRIDHQGKGVTAHTTAQYTAKARPSQPASSNAPRSHSEDASSS